MRRKPDFLIRQAPDDTFFVTKAYRDIPLGFFQTEAEAKAFRKQLRQAEQESVTVTDDRDDTPSIEWNGFDKPGSY